MEVTNVILNEKGIGMVELLSDDKKAGKMDIAVKGKILTVYHTEVDPEFGGRGFGRLLLEKLVSYARENDLKIVALCPYVHSQFKRNPDKYQDVWHRETK